jgi:protein TonB
MLARFHVELGMLYRLGFPARVFDGLGLGVVALAHLAALAFLFQHPIARAPQALEPPSVHYVVPVAPAAAPAIPQAAALPPSEPPKRRQAKPRPAERPALQQQLPSVEAPLPVPEVAAPTAEPAPPAPQLVEPATAAPAAQRSAPKPAAPLILAEELSVACPTRAAPSYPPQSRRLGEQGRVVLQVELDERGGVAAAHVQRSSGASRLDDAALAAVRGWRCNPARREGVPVRSFAVQPFDFVLR